MGIEYIDKNTAKLIVSVGSGKNRVRRTKRIKFKNKGDAKSQYRQFKEQVLSEQYIDSELTVEGLLSWYISRFKANGGKATTVRAYNVASKPIISYQTKKNSSLLKLLCFLVVRMKGLEPNSAVCACLC